MTNPEGLTTPVKLIPPPPATRRDRRLVRIAASGGARVDRFNRALLLAVGLVLAAAGALGLLLDQGTISWTSPGTTYRHRAADAVANPNLAAGIAMAVCLVVALLSLRWALAQLRPVSDGERMATMRLFAGIRGRTTIAATTVAKAAAADISNRPGIISAKVRLRALKPRARVSVDAEIALDADPEKALREIHDAVDRLLGALESNEDQADTELRIRFARLNRPTRGDRSARVQ